MNTDTPLILISNDDGYTAPGINKLVDMLRPLGYRLVVCAPDGARSGFSCAFSAELPLRLYHKSGDGQVDVWACNGTPVDCVKIAVDRILGGRMPDMVIGGINHGDNSTVNNHYSGTMGIAKEGCMKYIPSVAFSSCFYNHDANLEPLAPYIRKIVENVIRNGLPKGICLNVNFPAREEFKGVKVCRMTFGQWVNEIVAEKHPRGYDYFWMVGHYRNDELAAEDTDQWALDNGYVAITPTRIDVTAYEMMEQIKEWKL